MHTAVWACKEKFFSMKRLFVLQFIIIFFRSLARLPVAKWEILSFSLRDMNCQK